MNETIYLNVNPIVRSRENNLLRKDIFDNMLDAENVNEALIALQNTIYGTYISSEDFLNDYESFLDEEYSKTLKWAMEIAPDKEVVYLHSLAITYHNLKVATKALWLDKNLDDLFLDDSRFSVSDIKSAVKIKKSGLLPEFFLEAINEVMTYIDEYKTIEATDIIYDRYYLNHLSKEAQILNHDYIKEIITCYIDLTNIGMVIRGLLLGKKNPYLTAVLSSSGSISKSDLIECSEYNIDYFLNYIKHTKYSEIFENASTQDSDSINYWKVNLLIENYLTKMYQNAKIEVVGPLPLSAFIRAKFIEIQNIRLILSSKKNKFPRDITMERMRMDYVL